MLCNSDVVLQTERIAQPQPRLHSNSLVILHLLLELETNERVKNKGKDILHVLVIAQSLSPLNLSLLSTNLTVAPS